MNDTTFEERHPPRRKEVQAEAPATVEPQTASPRPSLGDWIAAHPRAVIITGLALALPYLLICTGMAGMIASSLLGGGCGG